MQEVNFPLHQRRRGRVMHVGLERMVLVRHLPMVKGRGIEQYSSQQRSIADV